MRDIGAHMTGVSSLLSTLGYAMAVLLSSLILPSCAQAQPASKTNAKGVTVVTSLGELRRFLEARNPPREIALAPGRYETIVLSNRAFATPVRITSADPQSPAILAGVKLQGVSNFSISNISLRPAERPSAAGRYGMLVLQSDRIVIEDVAFVGPGTEISKHHIAGLMLRESSDLTVRRNYFRNFRHGLTMLKVTNTRIALNEFERLQTDAIRGGGVTDLQIHHNVMTDFRPAEGDHPDGIQLWSTRQKEPGRNIEIAGNLVVRGAGGPTQGVFVRDTKLRLPFENITIRDNLIIGGLYNGIAVIGADGVLVRGNAVYSTSDRKSWIRLQSVLNASSRGNAAQQFIYRDIIEAVSQADNRVNEPVDDGEQAIIEGWLEGQSGFPSYRGPVLRGLLADGM